MTISHRELEEVLGGQLSELDWRHLSTIVNAATEESEILDFKQAFDQGPSADMEFAKDLCAFANARGGALVFGVREENGCAKEITPIEFSQGKEQQLRSWAHGRVFPSPEIEIQRIPSVDDANRGCLLVVVARSARQPHAVQKERDAGLRYVVRVGRDTRTLTESEVAQRYGERFSGVEARVERIAAVGKAQLGLRLEDSYCWVTLSLVPEVPGRFEISSSTLKQLETRARQIDSPRGLFRGVGTPEVRAGLRRARLTALTREGKPFDGYFEFHSDGAAFAGRQVFMPQGRPQLPVQNEVAPTILGSSLCMEVARCLRRAAEHSKGAGCSGAALAKVNVVAPPGTRLGLTRYEALFYHPSDPVPERFDPPSISIVLDEALSTPQALM